MKLIMDFNDNTPTKRLLESIHNKLGFSHNISTPPQRRHSAKNPFETLINEALHTNIISPTIFDHKTPKKQFAWDVDDLSQLHPIEIDHSVIVMDMDTPDKKTDAMHQEKINSFFSSQFIVPSPNLAMIRPALLKSHHRMSPSPSFKPGPSNPNITVRGISATSSTQTMLSLPPVLPKSVERVLQPYFELNDDQLLSKLHPTGESDCDSDDHEDSDDLETHHKAAEIVHASPVNLRVFSGKHSDADLNADELLDNWNVSPVSLSPSTDASVRNICITGLGANRSKLRGGPVAKLDFSANAGKDQMTMDLSTPGHDEFLDGISFHKGPGLSPSKRLSSSCVHELSAACSNLSGGLESECVEFHDVSPLDMDVTFSSTPKGGKHNLSLKKKLSDSVNYDDCDDEEDAHALQKMHSWQVAIGDDVGRCSNFDTGYASDFFMVDKSSRLERHATSSPITNTKKSQRDSLQ